jgi:hypothetical protein
VSVQPQRISRDDLEARFRAIQGDVQERVMSRRQQIVGIAAGVLIGVVVISYVLGRRKGRKTTVLEIRRL